MPGPRTSGKGGRSGRLRDGRPTFVWSLPALLFFALFSVVPLGVAVYLSFTEYEGIPLLPPRWVGLENWSRMLEDAALHRAVVVTIVLIVAAVLTQVPISLLIGVWAAGPQRNRAVISALYFIPLLMSSAAITVLFASILDPNFGVPATLRDVFGLGADNVFSNLLGNQWTALGVIAFIYLWGSSPLHTLLYQGGARNIPPVLYEAAAMDGAGPVQQFFRITIPMLRNTIVTSTIIMVVGTFTSFDIILLLTRGGPSGGTSNLPYFMYDQGIASLDFGYGSAVATLLIVIATLTSVAMVKATGYDKMSGTQEGI
ncbi:carbohydrate ABC transporter permease [Nocardioides bruguierae]|uniref:carbohydrate ABC transporter permease n=1 Tax=Nocardioides bruguierae TaxID=2945102 RepID=UPI0020215206|nr:sugar ABC transporter permease [Nocardioides bruguierae]MCL8025307.1 sugar ABC transporter permease [Nocardioides bruguierae]